MMDFTRMKYLLFITALFYVSCQDVKAPNDNNVGTKQSGIQLAVLGTVQDGGAPHIGCVKSCCAALWAKPNESLKVVSLGVIDHDHDKVYIFEATPDFPEQLSHLNKIAGRPMSQMPDGIFITHAHIGHYTGLMFLGREAKGASSVPVYAMPKLQEFFNSNGPWDQLVKLKNIQLKSFDNDGVAKLSSRLNIIPFKVPHRDEYSETVGFEIKGPEKSVLFIPDIDKWSKWEEDIIAKVKEVDLAFLDATFYDANEINNRDISEIPHPFVIESMKLFDGLSNEEKQKIHFIHLNHTNPLLNTDSKAYEEVVHRGYNVAQYGDMMSI